MRPQPLLCVSDVERNSRWYQSLLGCWLELDDFDDAAAVDVGRESLGERPS